MCVGERWIDLNGPGVALKRSLHVVHFLQRVSHVRVGVRKSRLDPDGLFVMHEGLVQLSLLLQNGCQVGVRGGKLGKHLQGLEIQSGGLFDVALFSLDVCQVV